MASHSSTLAWKVPWTEEPGGLQSMGSQRVRHDWATSLSLFTFMHWRRKWQPTPVFLTGESQGRGSLVDYRLWGRTELDTTEATNSSIGVIILILLRAWLMSSRPHKRTLVFLTPKSVLFLLYLLSNFIKLQNKIRVITLSFIEWRLSRIYYLDKLYEMISDSYITCKILLT